MRRDRCGGCGALMLETFLDLGASPLADRFPATAAEEETFYPLQVAVCQWCWLVQLVELVDDAELFGDDYGFYTGSSPSAVAYFQQYADDLVTQFGIDGLVVEIACNDGTLLAELAGRGCRVLGVEPATGPAEAARERGLDVVGEPFGVQTAHRIVDQHGFAQLVVANNVAAHVVDLADFFGGIAALLDDDGHAVVEVQYLADLLAGNQFDHVYHEHRYFFTAATIAKKMRHHGLYVQNIRHTAAQGGSLRVVAGRRSDPMRALWPDPPFLQDMTTYRSVQGRVDYLRNRLVDLVLDEVAAGRKVAGYAASAKSATLLNYCGFNTATVDHIVDITPAKIGRYTPGSKIPIVAPGDRPPPDDYLLLAWNYLPGVLRREARFLETGGRFIVPIPWPAVI